MRTDTRDADARVGPRPGRRRPRPGRGRPARRRPRAAARCRRASSRPPRARAPSRSSRQLAVEARERAEPVGREDGEAQSHPPGLAARALVPAPQVPLELLRDRLARRLGQLGGVLRLLELVDVLGDLGVVGRELVHAVLPRRGVLGEVAERHRLARERLDAVQQRERGLRRRRVRHVVRHCGPERDGAQPAGGRLVLQHADDARRALVGVGLDVEHLAHVGVLAGRGDRDRAGVRHVREQRAERDDGRDVQALGDVQQLAAVPAPAHRRLDAVHEDDLAAGPRGGGDRDRGGRPGDLAAAVRPDADHRAVHLEVVVLLRVELVDLLRAPRLVQVLERLARGGPGVVPALEGGEQDGLLLRQAGGAVRLVGHRPSVGRPAVACRTGPGEWPA